MASQPSHTSRCILCILNGCKSVKTCACGQEGAGGCVFLNGWRYSWWRLVVHDCAGGQADFITSSWTKTQIKGERDRKRKICRKNVLICCGDQNHYWEYFEQSSQRCCFAPHVGICIYAFGKTSSVHLVCIQDIHFISQACGLSITSAMLSAELHTVFR